MTAARHPFALLRRIAVVAMLLPFLAVSALPSGVMPGRDQGGTLTLVLCSGSGPQTVEIDLGTGRKAPAERQGCPFALVPAALLLPDGAVPDGPATRLVATEPVRDRQNLQPSPLPRHALARAPPALA